MKTTLAAVLFAFLQVSALAQMDQAVYSVTNVLDEKKSRLELWSLNVPEDKEIGYELTKEPFNKKSALSEKHVQKFWFKEIYPAGQTTYFRERLTRHPVTMRSGQRSYGYIEERNVKTHQVVKSFPIFYEVVGMGDWKRATFKIYLSEGFEEVITRDFLQDFYYLPLQERRVVSQRGIVQSHLLYKYERK
jgi:hypothetical protein